MAKRIRLTKKNDVFVGKSGAEVVLGLGGNDVIKGNGGADKLNGGGGNDRLLGGSGNDLLIGGGGKDSLKGGGGADRLFGGSGADKLNGGSGGDTYLYKAVGDSAAAAGAFDAAKGDVITGFTSVADNASAAAQDKIDLSVLAGKLASPLVWSNVTPAAFGVWHEVVDTATIVLIDTTGDGVADMAIKINSVETLTIDDFKGLIEGEPALGTLQVALSQDSGIAGDMITNDAGLTVTGVDDGAVIEYSIDNGATWSADFTAAEGVNSVQVRQKDASGNVSDASDALVFTLDTIAPTATISLNAVTADNIVNALEASGMVTVTGMATGQFNAGDIVTLSVNGKTLTAEVGVNGAFSIAVDGSDLVVDGDGQLEVGLATFDIAGNQGNANASTAYTVDLTSTAIALDAVTADNVVNIAEAGGMVNITGTVSGDAKAGDMVTLMVNAKAFTGMVAADNTFSIAVAGSDLVADSDMMIDASVAATDGGGNPVTADISKTYGVDEVAPVASINLDAVTADNILDAVEAAGVVGITGSVGDDVGEGDSVTLTINGKDFVGQVAADKTFAIAVAGSDLLADADMTVDAKVTIADAAGNPATAMASQTYTIDTTTTVIVLDAVTADNVVNANEAGGMVNITGTVGGDAKAGDTVTVIINGVTSTGTVAGDKTFSIAVAGSDLVADSDLMIEASVAATDGGGNSVTASTIKTYSVDTVPPSATLMINAVTSDNILNGVETAGNVVVTGAAGGEANPGDMVSLTVNGKTLTGTLAADNTFAITVSGADLVADGDLTIQASLTTTDAAGNSTIATASKTYDVSSAALAAPTVILQNDSGASASDKITNDGAIVVTGLASGATAEFSTDFGASWSAAFTAAEGVNTLLVRQKDGDGNLSLSSGISFTLDTTAPVAPSVQLVDDTGISNSDKITSNGQISVMAEPLGLIEYSLDGSSWTSSFIAANGVNSVQVRQTDIAGNVSDASAAFTFTLDQIVPTASITIEPVTGDDFISQMEAAGNITIKVGVGGEVKIGDSVTLAVGGQSLSGMVGSDFTVSFTIAGSELLTDPDRTVEASVTTADAAGNITTVTAQKGYDFGALVVDLGALAPTQGFTIQADTLNGMLGHSVSSAGDVNGDGLDDFIIGAPLGDKTGDENQGMAFVVFGGTNLSDLDLGNFSSAQGFVIQGNNVNDWAGWSVSSAGDVNGDGFDDVIVGAPFAKSGGVATGAAYVVFGGLSPIDVDLSSITTSQGFSIEGDTLDDFAGWSVSSAGDVNGDGFDDLVVGAPHGDDGDANAGEAYVVFGGANLANIDLTNLSPTQGFIVQGDIGFDKAGFDISSGGDINGDGFDDLIVGANYGDDAGKDAGEAYVIFGTNQGFGTPVTGRQVIDLTTLSASQGFIIQGDAQDDAAGREVSQAGDINGDGFDDLIIGAHYGSDGAIGAGEAYVVFGSDSGFGTPDGAGRQVLDLANLAPAQGFIIQGKMAGDYCGRSVSMAGDFNGDGFADLIIGAPYSDNNGMGSGEVYVVFGTNQGFGELDGTGRKVIDLTNLTAAQGLIIQGGAASDFAGYSVSSAGDINGDGFDDLIVGAVMADGFGAAYIIYGGAFGKGAAPVNITGTGSAEMLIGRLGNDLLVGGGGADVFRGGAGDDVIAVTGQNYKDIDGGSGYDTLRLDGNSDSFYFEGHHALAKSIEAFDMSAPGNQKVFLSKLDVLSLSDDVSDGITTITIHGSTGDEVHFNDTGWMIDGTVTVQGDIFNIFLNGAARVLVEMDILV